MAPCKFKSAWLDERDINGHIVKSWAKACNDPFSLYCRVCEKTVCIKRGKCGVNQHAQGLTHKEKYKIKLGDAQLHLHEVNNSSIVVYRPRQVDIL